VHAAHHHLSTHPDRETNRLLASFHLPRLSYVFSSSACLSATTASSSFTSTARMSSRWIPRGRCV
jgi:hypothetical protein